MDTEKKADWKKYAYSFLITAVIFATAIFASNFFNQKKINEIKRIESRIAVDILSSETQFSLLAELSCRDIGNSFLSEELAVLGEKLSYTEEQRGMDDTEVLNLKKYYSLLQIKDFLLMQRIKERCGTKTLSIIYFYSNEKSGASNLERCQDCEKEGYVLTWLLEEYPELRVYSFDYHLDLSAIKTLISIYDLKEFSMIKGLPILLINDKPYYGFRSIEEIKDLIPELKKIDALKIETEKKESQTEVATTSKKKM